MLHLVFSELGFLKAKKFIHEGDSLIFLDDGCFAAEGADSTNRYVVESHANQRGLKRFHRCKTL